MDIPLLNDLDYLRILNLSKKIFFFAQDGEHEFLVELMYSSAPRWIDKESLTRKSSVVQRLVSDFEKNNRTLLPVSEKRDLDEQVKIARLRKYKTLKKKRKLEVPKQDPEVVEEKDSFDLDQAMEDLLENNGKSISSKKRAKPKPKEISKKKGKVIDDNEHFNYPVRSPPPLPPNKPMEFKAKEGDIFGVKQGALQVLRDLHFFNENTP